MELRNIIFRGKSNDSGEWVYGDLLQYADTAQIWYGTDNGKWNCLVDPATVGQYTGVEDQSGQKIFEGDVIQTTKYGVDNGRGQNYSGKDKFIVGYSEGTYTLENGRRRFCLRPDTDAIVCGNIYDNPELLEEAQHDD